MQRSLLSMSLTALGVVTAAGAPPAAAQGFEGQIGRFYEDGGWDIYRLGMNRRMTGSLGLGVHGNFFRRTDGAEGGFAGLTGDLTAFKGGVPGPYLVAGVGAGMGSAHSSDYSSVWGSWSAGVGYELFPTSFLAFGVETRWREMSIDRRDGLELAAGLSFRFGGHAPRSRPGTSRPLSPVNSTGERYPERVTTVTESAGATTPFLLRDAVIATAKDAMGRPYSWGGTGEDGGGFDCSGLIQHAYSEHGIVLPRTSAMQAKEGKAVAKDVEKLAPGDLLTFSNRGGSVTHVGLYMGDGRFIHSASRGVQISVLSGEDPYGRWWFKRWVGARRIIDQ